MIDRDYSVIGWCEFQAAALLELRDLMKGQEIDQKDPLLAALASLDLAGVAEEIEDVGRAELSRLRKAIQLIIENLLSIQYRAFDGDGGKDWRRTIRWERDRLEDAAKGDVNRVFDGLPALYRNGCRILLCYDASLKESGSKMPIRCPYTREQILDEEFYPRPEGDKAEHGGGDGDAEGA